MIAEEKVCGRMRRGFKPRLRLLKKANLRRWPNIMAPAMFGTSAVLARRSTERLLEYAPQYAARRALPVLLTSRPFSTAWQAPKGYIPPRLYSSVQARQEILPSFNRARGSMTLSPQ